jgi:hypothetical protein
MKNLNNALLEEMTQPYCAMRTYRCLRGLLTPVDVLVKTRSEVERFRHVYASLESEILERGKVLYG